MSNDFETNILEAVNDGVKICGGLKHILLSNIQKTLATFTNAKISVVLAISMALSLLFKPLVYIAVAVLYMFIIDRFYRHLMYALMNAIGYKTFMQKTYSIIHKTSFLWRVKN